MLDCLNNCPISIAEFLSKLKLSPSFYIPHNILKYSTLVSPAIALELTALASQFHSYEAWVLSSQSPYFANLCYLQIERTAQLNDILKFSRFHIKIKNHETAIEILNKGLKFNSPLISRLLARLHLHSSPAQALEYARKAVCLGDAESRVIVAQLLDHPNLPKELRVGQISTKRASILSQLIAEIDPVFATNAQSNARVRDSKFITFITGIKIRIYNSKPIFCFMSIFNQWSAMLAATTTGGARKLPGPSV